MTPPAIVVGVDGSAASDSAVRWAERRAARSGARLVLAHIIDDEWGVSSTDRAEAREWLATIRSTVLASNPGLEVDVVCASGNPTHGLLRVANRSDLLVVGTHKTGFVQGRAFGSRSFRLAAAAQVPVAVIPERSSGKREGVIVGVDDTEAGRQAIRFAASEADRLGEDLTLLLALGTSDLQSSRRLERQSEISAMALGTAKQASAAIGLRLRAMRRPAAVALVDASASSALLVVGSSRRHTAQLGALGPVAHDVLFNITAPTIVVHPPEPAAPVLFGAAAKGI